MAYISFLKSTCISRIIYSSKVNDQQYFARQSDYIIHLVDGEIIT